jgi:hypothetical protein
MPKRHHKLSQSKFATEARKLRKAQRKAKRKSLRQSQIASVHMTEHLNVLSTLG